MNFFSLKHYKFFFYFVISGHKNQKVGHAKQNKYKDKFLRKLMA